MTKDEMTDWIKRACEHYGCSAKIAKIHYQQYVFRDWNPHPSKKFWDWCNMHPDYKTMRDAGTKEREAKVKMWNSECYNAQYREAKQFGLLGRKSLKLLQGQDFPQALDKQKQQTKGKNINE